MRSLGLAVLVAATVMVPGAVAAPAAPAANRCPSGGSVVAKAPLVTSDGVRLGKVRLLALPDGHWCGELRVAKAYRQTALIAETSMSQANASGVATVVAGDQGTEVESLTTNDEVAPGDKVRYRASLRGTSVAAKAVLRATVP